MQAPFASQHGQDSTLGFSDRIEAGRLLAQKLVHYKGRPDVIVLGLPRGGVPVAFEVARALQAPLDVFLVKKIGVPGYEELALGAAASGGIFLIDPELASNIGLTSDEIQALTHAAHEQLQAREKLYRADLPAYPLKDKTVILVDDGLATGSSMQAAVAAVRRFQPARVVVAVPVAARETCEELRTVADEVVCASTPAPFFAVGAWYDDFRQTSDDEVIQLLHRAAEEKRS
ncbi:MAG: phosphoribosyltransferase [Candidatus Eremiobacteraeota bacterium]|nr:phosphoribosyltransferase [Candidatus Eremiobacteraeota bacterium]